MAVIRVKRKSMETPLESTTSTPMIQQTPLIPSTYATINEVWDVVGSDNIHEKEVDSIVVRDKMSMLLYALFLNNDLDGIAKMLQKMPVPPSTNDVKTSASTTGGTSFADNVVNPLENTLADQSFITEPIKSVLNIGSTMPMSKPIPTISERCKSYIMSGDCLRSNFAGGVSFNSDYISEKDRFDALGMKSTAYSFYKLSKIYSIIPVSQQSVAANANNLFYMAPDLDDYSSKLSRLLSGFPNRSLNGNHLQFPIFDLPTFRMQFFFRGKKPEESMMVAKNIFFTFGPNGEPYLNKQYLPVIFLRDSKFNEVYSVFAGLPGKDGNKLPLYNTYGVERIKQAESVVICGTIEDADAMQRYDTKNKKCAYIAFVCDRGEFDQVDFTPLKGKRVEFLISNHGNKTIEKERRRIYDLCNHLKRLQRPRIKDFSFRERVVQYPSDRLQSQTDYCNAYLMQKPRVISQKTYSETDFLMLLANQNGEVSIVPKPEKKDEAPSRSESAIKKEKCTKNALKKSSGRPKHLNLTAEKTLLRPFIRRGCTTVLTGDPGIGKSRFAIALAAQVAGSKAEFLKDRFWTRCLPSNGEKSGYKVVYWVFDDVDQDDIFLQRNYFAKGLNSDQEKNLIIEPARSIRKRDSENLKEELKKYASMGTPDHPVDFLIVDTLLSFARTPAKIFSAFEELVRLKDEMPGLAILVLHHNSKEGNPFGGILSTNMPRVIIEMQRDNTSVLDDLEDPITINVIKHSNEHYGIDVVPFEIKLVNDHFAVTNNTDMPQKNVEQLIIYEYKHNRLESYSNTDIGRLLGVPRSKIEKIWNADGVKENTQILWEDTKRKLKDKAKALKEASLKNKKHYKKKHSYREDFNDSETDVE